ncbi:MAG: YfhO family protein [Bacteroidia bacterium]
MNFKKFLPHIVAIGAFLVISLFYFSPLIDGKKQIQQSDIMHFKGTAQEIVDFRKDHPEEEPLWTNSMFGGMPAYQISVQYHANLMKYVDNAFLLWLPHPIGMVFLYFFGFYILLLCLRINPWIAAVGALAYGFSSFFFIILEVGHNTQAHAIAYMAPLLGGIILTLRKNYILGGALTTLFAALELYANHVQITYYFFMVVAAIMLVEFYAAIKEKRILDFIKRGAIVAVAIVIAVLPNISNLWATYEYGKYTTRGTSDLTINENGQSNAANKTSGLDKDYATAWSYGISETFNLFIPNFKGGASESIAQHNKGALDAVKDPQMRQYVGNMYSYFGNQTFTMGPVYIGAIMIFLAVLGLFLIKDRIKWALLAITIISIMLAWGRNLMWFTDIFFDYFPGYNKFRSISMILVIAELTIPLLAVLALQKIYESTATTQVSIGKKTMPINRVLIIVAAITGGFALLCYLAPDMFNKFQADNELSTLVRQVKQQNPEAQVAQIENMYAPVLEQTELARKAIFKSDAIRTFIFILLVFGALWLFLTKKINQQLMIAALAIFVLADMWPVAARFLNSSNYVPKAQMQNPFPKTKADEYILQDKTLDYRVLKLGNPFNDASTSYWHKSIGGYHGAKLKRYHELMSFQLDQEMASLMQSLRSSGVSDSSVNLAFTKTQVLNMLNTKYVIVNDDAPPLPNIQANGNAWFVKNILSVNSANDEILKLSDINTKEIAIINSIFNIQNSAFQYDADASIKLNSYQANKLVYETNAKTEQLAVFSEIYYPKGWIATIDGKESPYVNADYVLRAMLVPAGKHTIEFNFKPAVYVVGEKISLAGSLLVLLISFGGMFYAYKKESI